MSSRDLRFIGSSAACLALVALTLPGGARAQTTGPHLPVHALDLGGGQSLVVRLAFDGPTAVRLESARIVDGRPHGRSGDAPLLRLSLRNAAGAVMSQVNAWHPLWALEWTDEDRDRKRMRSKGRGRFVLPYSPNAPPARIEFTDVALQRALIAVDFADVAVSVPVTPTLPAIAVGKSFLVTLPVGVTSHGPSLQTSARLTSSAKGTKTVAVSPASRTATVSAVSVGTNKTVGQAFTMTCTGVGTSTIIVDHVLRPVAATTADLVGANDRASTRLTVACVAPQL